VASLPVMGLLSKNHLRERGLFAYVSTVDFQTDDSIDMMAVLSPLLSRALRELSAICLFDRRC